MSSKKSNVSFNTDASSKTSKKPIEKDPYELWRPPEGVRYELEETKVDLDAFVPRVKLKYTTVEYEPGQDLTVREEDAEVEKFVKQRGRGPVFQFQEDIDDFNYKQKQLRIINAVLKNYMKRQNEGKKAIRGVHKRMMHLIGPTWYHELSPKQMQSADYLKEAMKKDHIRGTIINTQETLTDMGIVLRPNHTKVEYALEKYYKCPVEFLLTIVRLNRPKEPEKKNDYTLNDRIMLSCVVHLTMRETLRELHLRIPSPPNIRPKPKKKKKKKHGPYRKYDKWKKGMSPLLEPLIPVEQHHIEEIYKNRHKEYASLDYFDYVNDMWDVFWVDDPESVHKRKAAKLLKQNKWNRPPRIPVRFIESKMKKKKIYLPKKPSPYNSPCKPIKFTEADTKAATTEKPIVINIGLEDICCCAPQNFNENTAFDLKIKITTSEDELLLTQKLCPYSSVNNIGDLNLVEQTKLKERAQCAGEHDGKPFKKIEYSCECCTCGKSINIFPDDNTTTGLQNIKQTIDDQFEVNPNLGLTTIVEEGEAYELYEGDGEESDHRICKCRSMSEHTTTSSDILYDPYYLCTCKASSDSCTCCICDQMDKEFLLKLKRYNEIHGTKHQPCFCACKCKKKKKTPCCDTDDIPCKYCFCRKQKTVVEEEETPEEEPKVPEAKPEVKIAPVKPEVKPAEGKSQAKAAEVKPQESPRKSTREKITKSIMQMPMQEEENEKEECKCDDLYNKFVDQHESCLSLFEHYQKKIEEDVQEYLKDMKERCLCADSDSAIDEEEEEADPEVKGEQDSDGCPCQKNGGVCTCVPEKPKSEFYSGCTCNSVAGCTCNSSDSTSSDSTSSGSSNPSDPCLCSCTCCKGGPCQCAVMLQQVQEAKAAKQAELESKVGLKEEPRVSISKEKKSKSPKNLTPDETPTTVGEDENVEEEEEPDPRIFVLDEFPTKHKDQMELLKKALEALAEDGYPLAKLPDVHRLPQFQVWLNKRAGTYVSMEDRGTLYEISKIFWQHIEICQRKVAPPDMPIPINKVQKVTWSGVNTYKYLIAKVKTDYRRRLKQAYIDQAQEMFPSCFFYALPTKTFREVYFSYLPADENHVFVFKPWELHEHKDMSKRKPCL